MARVKVRAKTGGGDGKERREVEQVEVRQRNVRYETEYQICSKYKY